MALRIVALDLALTATGIAATHLHTGVQRLNARTVYAGARGGHDRIQHHLLDVAAAVKHRPHLVVIEGLPLYAGKGDVTIRLAELHGVVKHWLWNKGIAYVDIEPASAKIYATGNGNATKYDVLSAVIAEYGRTLHVGTDHEADALAMLSLALHNYGEPLSEVLNPRRTRALQGVQWPRLGEVPRG